MCTSTSIRRLLLLAVLLVAAPAHGQPTRLECGVAPVDPGCVVVLPRGEKAIRFSVRPLRADSSAYPQTQQFTVSATRCCTDTVITAPDVNGFLTVTWQGEAAPAADVVVTFSTVNDHRLHSGSVTIRPQAAPAPHTLTTEPDVGTLDHYVWVRDDHIPVPIEIAIRDVGGDAPDQSTCERVRVTFRPRMDGKASPDTGYAVWHPDDDHEAGDTVPSGECLAHTRWRLANDAGSQQMDIYIGGANGISTRHLEVEAYARHTPRLTGGFGYFRNMRSQESVPCAERPGDPGCVGRPDSSEVMVAVTQSSWEPYFALELPVFLGYRPSNRVTRYLYSHLRLTLGATFDHPEDNFFVGVNVFPLLSGDSEASPFQLSVGLTNLDWERRYVGMSLDATEFIKPALKVIGVPGL